MPEPTLLLLVGVGVVVAALIWIRVSLAAALRRETRDAILYLEQQAHASALQTTQQVEHLRAAWQSLSGQVLTTLDQGRQTVDNRLSTTNKVIGDVHHQLGQLGESARQIADIGKSMTELQSILKSPKLRGNLGEWFLAELLAQLFPADQYQLHYAFRGGETVDAVLRLQQGLVPIDAKFPLEQFQRQLQATDASAIKQARREFVRDVKKHIDAIAAKYIRPDEGTFPFALMYVPAENVFYEAVIRDEEAPGTPLHAYAIQRNVIPVSPNSFFAYLQTILLGLKGLRIEENARHILNLLDRLHGDVQQFGETFRVVGSHLDNARKKVDDAERAFAKIEARLDQVDAFIETGREDRE